MKRKEDDRDRTGGLDVGARAERLTMVKLS